MIKILLKSEYLHQPITFTYETDAHYLVTSNHTKDTLNFTLKKIPLLNSITKTFVDHLYADHLENATAFGYFEDEILKGIVEINHEQWNNRVRITEFIVFDPYKKQGIGRKLMDYVKTEAKVLKARAMVLETQTCNIPAISFYWSQGFHCIGFDMMCYHNDDITREEVRIELGLEL